MKHLVRYACVGGVAAVCDIAIFIVFAKLLGFNYLLIGGVGFILATGVNYLLSIRFVFESGSRFSKKAEIASIYVVSGIGLAIHEFCLYFLVSILSLEIVLAKIASTGIVFFWNFLVRKHYVFAKGNTCQNETT